MSGKEKRINEKKLKPVIDYFLQGIISLDPSPILELKGKKKLNFSEDVKYREENG